jgi:hypothetical protein
MKHVPTQAETIADLAARANVPVGSTGSTVASVIA